MNFELTDEQRMLIDSVSRFVKDNCSLEQRRKLTETDDSICWDKWRQFGEMGWLALTTPEAADGLGAGVIELALMMEELGRGLVIEPIIDSSVLSASILADSKAPLAATTLSQIVSGETIVTLAHIEQDSRSEKDTLLNSTAVETDKGWQLDGHKTRVFHGQIANHLIISAKLSSGELGLFLVERAAITQVGNAYELIDGSKSIDVTFSKLSLPADALILQGSDAEAALALALDKAIIAGCASSLGSMEEVMQATAEYLKTRVQYGTPIAKFQALQHRMSEMLIETEQARSILCRALSLFDNAAERACAVSTAKVIISKSALWVTGQGIQLHGGIGVTEELAVGHHYKATLCFEQRFGDSDWHLENCESLIAEI